MITCTQLSDKCVCSDGVPAAGEPATCSTSSVAKSAGEQGLCCRSNSFCECDSYVCESDALGCTCADTFVVDGVIQGTKLAACPAPTTSQKCCLSTLLHQCRCSASDCLGADEKEVPSCGLSDVSFCSDGWNTVNSCK